MMVVRTASRLRWVYGLFGVGASWVLAAAPGCGGAAMTEACSAGTFDEAGGSATRCVAWTVCGPGERVQEQGTDTTDRVCAPCSSGTFSAAENSPTCAAWLTCVAGDYVTESGSAVNDRACAPCAVGTLTTGENQSLCVPEAGACLPGTVQTAPAAGATPPSCAACVAGQYCAGAAVPAVACGDGASTWDDDTDPATACVLRSECGVGTRVAGDGDATHDRTCVACTGESFSAATNATACDPWGTCAAGSFVSNTPSSTSDRVCTLCAEGTYSSGPNQSVCVPVGSCAPGTVQTVPGSADSPPTCTPCVAGQYCAGADTAAVACGAGEWDHDMDPATVCVAHGDCQAGTFVSGAGTATSNRACTACTGETFSNTINAAQCSPWRTCDGGMELTSGSSTTDRTCTVSGWLRQFGPVDRDARNSAAASATDDVYVLGSTYGELPGQTSVGDLDMFLRKYDSSGDVLWTRQFGTELDDVSGDVSVDASGNVLVTGYTAGAVSGHVNAGDWDVVVYKFDSEGNALWARQFGSDDSDYGFGVGGDASGNVFVGGSTWGALPGHTNAGRSDAFVAKYDANGTLQWTRQVGGSSDEDGSAIAVDASGATYVTGATYGTLPGQSSLGQTDYFIVKHDSAGDVVWTRQLGTASWEETHAIGVDLAGNLYVAGLTDQESELIIQGLLEKYDADGNLVWSRTFGTVFLTEVKALDIDAAGNVYLIGNTREEIFAGEPSTDIQDVFMRSYDSTGALRWDRALGTIGDDYGRSISVSPSGYVYAAGFTEWTFPGQTPAPHDSVWVTLLDL